MLHHTWNTGRPYTAAGQEITAVCVTPGRIAFTDHSRMIQGVIEVDTDPITAFDTLQRVVMHHYDHLNYHGLLTLEEMQVLKEVGRARS